MFAKPTKEWVIPAKPRPGRKLKKDTSAAVCEDDEEEAKKIQNRAAQRAFRERKQSQLSDLQARIAQYEQGEIERNVALQALAKRLKDENDALKKENAELKAKGDSFVCSACTSKKKNLKRGADDDADATNETGRGRSTTTKRMRSTRALSTVSSAASSVSYDSLFVLSEASTSLNPPSFASSSTSYVPAGPQDRRSAAVSHKPQKSEPQTPSTQNIPIHNANDESGDLQLIGCGFCSPETSCACRESTSAQNDRDGTPLVSPRDAKSSGTLATKTAALQSLDGAVMSPSSILNHLPPYAPPVPLRRSSKLKSSSASATEKWIITPGPSVQTATSSARSTNQKDDGDDACTGDPANCPACADDPANQAFCAALGDAYSGGEDEIESSATATPPLRGAAGNQRRAVHFLDEDDDMMVGQTIQPTPRMSVLALCCGDPKLCGGGCDAGSGRGDSMPLVPLPGCSSMDEPPAAAFSGAGPSGGSDPRAEREKDMIPCNTAWAQLSSHPNIAFADLSLLADVVARRDHIHVPSSKPSPFASGAASPASHHQASSSAAPSWASPTTVDRTLVPQDHLIMIQNGLGQRRRVRQVPNDGVQDALALLDGVRTLT